MDVHAKAISHPARGGPPKGRGVVGLALRVDAPPRGRHSLAAEWVEHINGVTPIVAEPLLKLVDKVLAIKCEFGSDVEKSLYVGMTRDDLITRTLTKRPLTFWLESDAWKLKSGEEGRMGFDSVGTDEEAGALKLADYMSYDEIAIAALVSISVPTHFMNSGGRGNRGKQGDEGSYVSKGVYTACVGAVSKQQQRHSTAQPYFFSSISPSLPLLFSHTSFALLSSFHSASSAPAVWSGSISS